MANNQLNWSHFRPEFSGKPEEDAGSTFAENRGLDDYP